jgi:hypothetical protein
LPRGFLARSDFDERDGQTHFFVDHLTKRRGSAAHAHIQQLCDRVLLQLIQRQHGVLLGGRYET